MRSLFIFLLISLLFSALTFAQDNTQVIDQIQLATVVKDTGEVLESLNTPNPTSRCTTTPGPETASNTRPRVFQELNNMFLIFKGEKTLITDEMVKKTIDDPLKLKDNTLKKIEDLPLNILLSQSTSKPLTLDQFATQKPIEFLKTGLNTFSSDELTDLQLYFLTKAGVLPSESEGWGKLISTVQKYEGWLMVGVFAGAVATDSLNIPLRGRLFKIKDGKISGGWYADVSSLGLNFKPKLTTGITLSEEHGFSARLGVTQKIDANFGQEKTAIQTGLYYNSKEINPMASHFAAAIEYHQALEQTDPTKSKAGTLNASVYTTSPLHVADGRYTLSGGLTLTHQFQGQSSQGLFISVVDRKNSFGASLRAGNQYDPVTKKNSPFVGFVFGKYLNWGSLRKSFN